MIVLGDLVAGVGCWWHSGITAARVLRDELLARRGRGERVAPNPRLRFGEASEKWLDGPVRDLRTTTQTGYRNAVERHLRPRFSTRRMDTLTPDDLVLAVTACLCSSAWRSSKRCVSWSAAASNAASSVAPYGHGRNPDTTHADPPPARS